MDNVRVTKRIERRNPNRIHKIRIFVKTPDRLLCEMVSNRSMIPVNFDTFSKRIGVHETNRVLTAFAFQQLDIHSVWSKILVEARKREAVTAQQRRFQRKVLQLEKVVRLFGIALLVGRPEVEQHLRLVRPLFRFFACEPEHFGQHQVRTCLDSSSDDIRVKA